MKTKRKIGAIIGVPAIIGVALWMRELTSWRPVTVGQVPYVPQQLCFSKDGKWLLVKSDTVASGTVFGLQTTTGDSRWQNVRNSDKNDALDVRPGVRIDRSQNRYVFAAAPRQSVRLEKVTVLSRYIAEITPHVFQKWHTGGAIKESVAENLPEISHVDKSKILWWDPEQILVGEWEMQRPDGKLRFGWSKARHEVYGALNGEILVWDWTTGKLKKRMRYAKSGDENAVFSPDGKWLLALETSKKKRLRRYDVQTGQVAAMVDQNVTLSDSFGFSPDGQFLWFVRQNKGIPFNFNVLRLSDNKYLMTAPCSGPVKWLPDGRIGLVGRDDFSWRTGTGQTTRRLPGPLDPIKARPVVQDWVESPDGKWIYSAEQSGAIRRWRAR